MRKARNSRAVEQEPGQVEEALRQSEERFRKVFEDGPLGMVMVNPGERRFDRANAAFCRMLGYTEKELLSLTVTDVTHPEHRKKDAVELKRVLAGEIPSYRTEKRYLRKDGRVVWGSVIAGVIRDPGGKPLYSLAMVEDITDRRRMEQALRRSEDDLKALFDGAREAIMLLDARGTVLNANAAMCERLGVAPDEFVGRYAFDALPPLLAKKRRARFDDILRSGKPQLFEDERDGRTTESHMYPILGPSGHVTRVAVFVIDITNRKRTETALRVSRDELEQRVAERTARLRTLAARLTHAEHRERRRIADVLHEDLQQHLVAMQYRVSALRAREGDGPNARDAEWLLEELARTIELSRDLTVRLRPPVLYELGLVPALDWLADDMRSRFGLAVTVGGVKSFRLESDEIRVFVFEAIRELLLNVVKHAGVKRARIRMRWAGKGNISIEVSDSGKGFDAARHTQESSFGLFSIRERIEALGGRLDVSSRPGHGTRAVLILPARSARSV